MYKQTTNPAVSGTKSAQMGQLPLLIFVIIQQKSGAKDRQTAPKSVSLYKFLLLGLVFSSFEGYYK